MLNNKLLNEFNFNVSEGYNISDYKIFKNKEELETLRRNILEKLGDLTFLDTVITKDIIINVLNEETKDYNLTNLERSHLYNIIDNEINSYGPLKELLEDDNVSEIMVNGPSDIFISIGGRLIKEDGVSFINDDHIIRTIKKLLKDTDVILENNPSFSARINNNAILNVVMPPLSKGPILTIKKYNNHIADFDELLKLGTLTPYMARFLEASVRANLNIVVCGSSRSGKSSLLNSLGNLISDSKRVIVIEKVNELDIKKNNIVTLSVLDNEDKIIDMSLKMSPDTLILGKLNESVMYQVLDVMLSRKINVLTTLRSSSVVDAVNKIENVITNRFELSHKQIINLLYNGLDLVVFTEELSNHKHKITSICEFNKNKNNEIVLKEIFGYKISDDDTQGEFTISNVTPRAYDKIKAHNIDIIDDIFN